ncbi:unnamed protein product [Oikopleura dioica]|uniref:RRM domain-containing protein n=1 Tax=Oikopleura dioica TaxID=34765 RepID=E4XCV5_OIKDI|nr:unnamed protein product [Oikopleura dioica]
MGRERYYTVWMGDLPPGIKRGHVKDFFEEYGPLGGIRLMNNFGFIDFRKKKDAKEAVKELDGKKLKGARIRLEHSDGPGGSKKKGEDYDAVNFPPIGGQSSMYERPYRTKYTISVSNLSTRFSWADLKNFMRRAGEVTYTDAHVRSGEGNGEVCFKDRKGLYRAMQKLNSTRLGGKKIRLRIVEDGSREVPSDSESDSDSDRSSRSGSRSSYSSRSSYDSESGSGSSRSRSRSRSRSKSNSKSRSRSRSRSNERKSRKDEEKKKSRRESRSRSRSKDKLKKENKRRSRSRSRSRGKDRRSDKEREERDTKERKARKRSMSREREGSRDRKKSTKKSRRSRSRSR